MNYLSLSLLVYLLFGFSGDSEAALLDLHGKRRDKFASGLVPRANIFGQSALDDMRDVLYHTNITLGGQHFTVLVDTGSSDLWVASHGKKIKSGSTGITTSLAYAIGAVQGTVELAALEFAGYNISDQAFILVPPNDDNPGTGTIGLGPNSGSVVHAAVDANPLGDTVLDRVFRMNTSTPNYVTILLGRSDDPAHLFPGELSVGEILHGYEAVTDQPKLSVSIAAAEGPGYQHWQTLIDADGIIGADGQAISLTTIVNATSNKHQLTTTFDTGFTYPQVPSALAKAIYGNITGAKLENITDNGLSWTLPCDAEANITFKFGGKAFPVHPLDLSLDYNYTGINLPEGRCLGTFQPIGANTLAPDYDMILGMAFLRNAYLLINFGDFVDGSNTSSVAKPYIQMLSTTNDTARARSEFASVRGGSSSSLESTSTIASFPPSTTKKKVKIPLIIAVTAIGACLVLGITLAVFAFCGRRRSENRRAPRTAGMAAFLDTNKNPYVTVGEPAPPMAAELVLGSAPYDPHGSRY